MAYALPRGYEVPHPRRIAALPSTKPRYVDGSIDLNGDAKPELLAPNLEFWEHHGEATVKWPGTTYTCAAR